MTEEEIYALEEARAEVESLRAGLSYAVKRREAETARAIAAESEVSRMRGQVETERACRLTNEQEMRRADAEIGRLRCQVEGAWRAGAEAAAKACEEEAERCLDAAQALDLDEEDGDQEFAQNILLDQAGRIRLLPPPSAPADDTDTNHKEKP